MGDAGEFVRTQNELADQAARWVRRLAVEVCLDSQDRREQGLRIARVGRMAELVRVGPLGLLESAGWIVQAHPDDLARLDQDRGAW